MHGFEECCHLGLRSILQILRFHIFTASSKARLGRHTCSKLIVRALKDGSRIKGNWLVRDRNARASSGRRAEKGKKKIPTIFISIVFIFIFIFFKLPNSFSPLTKQPRLMTAPSRSWCPNKNPSPNTEPSAAGGV